MGQRACGVVAVLGLLGAAAVSAQSSSFDKDMPDPNLCVVVLENMGDVGLRISDAQAVTETVMDGLRKRLGNHSVVYEGVRKNAEKMKQMLGKDAETKLQDAQLAYFDAAAKHAPWRIRARLGRSGKESSITVTCKKRLDAFGAVKDDKSNAPVDEITVSGKTFNDARDALRNKMTTFCAPIAPPIALPIEGSPTTAPGDPLRHEGFRRPTKEPRPWTPPPRRD